MQYVKQKSFYFDTIFVGYLPVGHTLCNPNKDGNRKENEMLVISKKEYDNLQKTGEHSVIINNKNYSIYCIE